MPSPWKDGEGTEPQQDIGRPCRESLLDQQAWISRKLDPTPNACSVENSASGSKDVADNKIYDFVAAGLLVRTLRRGSWTLRGAWI
jgi:hypothetical protein